MLLFRLGTPGDAHRARATGARSQQDLCQDLAINHPDARFGGTGLATARRPLSLCIDWPMRSAPPDIEWFRSQLSHARAHLDIALGEGAESARRANIESARESCKAVTAALYKAQLAPGERTEIEGALSSLRSGLQALESR